MVKYVLGGVVVFLVVAAAFYGGFFIGRAKSGPPAGVPPAPSEDHWTYPGAAEVTRVGGKESFLVILDTPDDFDSVARFYHQRISMTTGLGDEFNPQSNGTSSAGFAWGSYTRASDKFRGEGGGAPQVRVWTFEVRSQVYDLNVFVNRADWEGHTHITVTYDPKPPR